MHMDSQNIKQVKEKLSKVSFEVPSQNSGVPDSSYDLWHCKNEAGLASTPLQLSQLGGKAQNNTHMVEGGVPGALVVYLEGNLKGHEWNRWKEHLFWTSGGTG